MADNSDSDSSFKVDRKVKVGAASLAAMTIAAWISRAFAGVEIPADVALAGATLVNFVLQWAIPNAEV